MAAGPLAACVDTFGLRLFDALALPLLQEATFHLRDPAKHRQHGMAHLALGRDTRVENGDESPALLDLVDHVEHIAGVATNPVEAGDHQFVAGPEELDDGCEFGAAFTRAA